MTRIAVFGEMLVDQFESGPVVGGAPFNVARHLAAFGHAPLMLSAVGVDDHAALVMREFDRYGMRRDGVQVTPAHPTGVVDVQTAPDGGHRFSVRADCAWDFIGEAPARAAAAALDPAGWLYAGTLALRSPVSRATAWAVMRAHAGPIYLDLNWREGQVAREVALQALGMADVLKVNDEELVMLCGWLHVPAAGEIPTPDNVRHLLQRLPLQMLLITCGAEGALAFDGEGRCIAEGRDTRPLHLVDTVGAGDSFSAVVLAGLLRGWDMGTTLARANAFAGHICEVRGAVPPDVTAYAQWVDAWR